MNCRDALRLLYDVVDREANEHDMTRVHEHIKTCHKCTAQFEMELAFKKCIEEKGKFSPECHELKVRIIQQLDAIDDAAGEVGHFRPPFRWIAVGLATAAAIVLTIIAAQSLGGYYRHQAEIVPFFNAHLTHLAHSEQEYTAIDPFDFLYAQTGIRLQPSPQLPIDVIHSVSIDTIAGIPFGCIDIDAGDSHVISVFVAPRDRYTVPSGPCRVINGSEMLVRSSDGCCLIGCARNNVVFMMVGESHHEPAELARMISYF